MPQSIIAPRQRWDEEMVSRASRVPAFRQGAPEVATHVLAPWIPGTRWLVMIQAIALPAC